MHRGVRPAREEHDVVASLGPCGIERSRHHSPPIALLAEVLMRHDIFYEAYGAATSHKVWRGDQRAGGYQPRPPGADENFDAGPR